MRRALTRRLYAVGPDLGCRNSCQEDQGPDPLRVADRGEHEEADLTADEHPKPEPGDPTPAALLTMRALSRQVVGPETLARDLDRLSAATVIVLKNGR